MVPAMENFFPKLEKMLARTGSGFFGKKGPTWADFVIASGSLTAKNFVNAADMAKHPEIDKHCQRVHALPQLKEYLAKRKDTKF